MMGGWSSISPNWTSGRPLTQYIIESLAPHVSAKVANTCRPNKGGSRVGISLFHAQTISIQVAGECIRVDIHPGKMDIISASDKALKFSVGSETVKAKDPKHIFHVLGSPLCF